MQRLHPGLITVVQRFRSDGGLFVHLHVLATDGAFEEQPDGNIVFHPLTDLHERDLARVLDAVAADLSHAGLPDDLDIDAALASCVQLSLSTPTAPTSVSRQQDLVAFAHGMNLHAATTVDGRDKKRLERVCKYLLRPPFSLDAVHLLPDGRVRLDLPRSGRCVIMTPHQFLAKLCALVPPPRQNLVRYAGCFANRHRSRPRIVPHSGPPAGAGARPPKQLLLFDFAGRPMFPAPTLELELAPPRMHRRSWAHLLARVFSIDIESCPRPGCHGRLKIVDVVVDPDQIALLLHGARAPPGPPPRGQLSLLPT